MTTTAIIMSALTLASTNVELPTELVGNPLVEEWNTPYQTPPFSEIEYAHYVPAFDYAI